LTILDDLILPSDGVEEIVLDADGVLVDYRAPFPQVYKRAFGVDVAYVADMYHAHNMFGVPFQNEAEWARFFESFGDDVWSNLPAMPGAVNACERLVAAGHRLTCVTAIPPAFRDARRRNLKALGFPIERVICTDRGLSGVNPKLEVVRAIAPVAFVEDMASNFEGIEDTTHAALLHRDQPDTPNTRTLRALADSEHVNLAAFVDWWLADGREAHRIRHA
jgi:phosphoglycolate phosphatase-like HAD superfamily hydrolase